MNRDLQKASQLYTLPTVAAGNVPSPGDGPVLFADSDNDGAVTAKLPGGTSMVVGASYMANALLLGANGDTVETTATVAAASDSAVVADALSQADVGKTISIEGAGDTADLITTITAISADGLTVTLADAATDGATDGVTFVGTADEAALDALDPGASGTLLVPPGKYLIADDLTIAAGTVTVMRGASFVVLEGFTLAFSGFVDAAPNQIPLLLDDAANGALTRDVPNVIAGAGSPETAVIGIIGDIFQRTNGSTDTAVYRKESGDNTDTGWIPVEAP